MTDQLTEDDLNLLTEAERAGLSDEDDETGTSDQPELGTTDTAPTATTEVTPADQVADAGHDAKGEAEAQTTETAASAEPLVPLFRADTPAGAKERLAAIDAEKLALDARIDSGDITAREYRTALAKLDDERDDLKQGLFKSELSAEIIEQQRQSAWFDDVRVFMAEHPEIQRNKLLYGAFDQVVREVTADQANAGLSNRKQLEKAHATWADQLGIQGEKGSNEKPAGKAATKPAKQPVELPPTLARVPAAATTGTEDARWSSLDRLLDSDPAAYEAAFAKLGPAERDAYLKGAGAA